MSETLPLAPGHLPSGRAPKELLWLDLDAIGGLKYRQKGGGKFTDKEAALARQRYLADQGIPSTLYTSGAITWTPVEQGDTPGGRVLD